MGCAVADATAPADALAALIATDPGAAKAALIAEAKRRGATWAQIAPTIGAENGKAAKAEAKRLARKTQAAMLAQAASDLEAV
jgi:hypothetical protein